MPKAITNHAVNVLQSTPAAITNVIDSFFPTGSYTLSSMTRKSINVLMYLTSKYPKGSWYFNFEYENYAHKCTARIANNRLNAGIYIVDKATEENIAVHRDICVGLINKLFVKDKFITGPIKHSTVKIKTNAGNFIYEKAKVRLNGVELWTLHMRRGSWTPRATWYKWFGSMKEKPIEIGDFEVIEQKLDDGEYDNNGENETQLRGLEGPERSEDRAS